MNTLMALGKAAVVQLLAVLSRTSNSSSTGLDIRDYTGMGMVVFAAGAATAGSSPTLDAVLEESDDNSTWSAVAAADYAEAAEFTQVTTTATVQIRRFDVSKRKRYIRITWTIGGTSSPAFPFGAGFIGQKQYA